MKKPLDLANTLGGRVVKAINPDVSYKECEWTLHIDGLAMGKGQVPALNKELPCPEHLVGCYAIGIRMPTMD